MLCAHYINKAFGDIHAHLFRSLQKSMFQRIIISKWQTSFCHVRG